MKTFSPRPRDIERRWYVVNADGAVLGRLASEVAKVLRGKHKPIFAPHMDTGDNVIVVNARGIRLTGGKEAEKRYYRHSGYPGGIRGVDYTRLLAERPALAVEKAIKGMLPKNRLGRQMFTKLAVYEGPEHPHQAQKPVPLGLGEIPEVGGTTGAEGASCSASTNKAGHGGQARGEGKRGQGPRWPHREHTGCGQNGKRCPSPSARTKGRGFGHQGRAGKGAGSVVALG
jgi:large subunit ribosomal protein L13